MQHDDVPGRRRCTSLWPPLLFVPSRSTSTVASHERPASHRPARHCTQHDNAAVLFFVARTRPRIGAAPSQSLPSRAHSSARKAAPPHVHAANITRHPPFTRLVTSTSTCRAPLRIFLRCPDAAHHIDQGSRVQTGPRADSLVRIDIYLQCLQDTLVASHVQAGLSQGHYPDIVPRLQEQALDQ
jgi:hypothetical protein